MLDWVIFKISERCNLDCTYCYVYNRGDDGWKTRPPIVSDEVVIALATRVADHYEKYKLQHFDIEFHGGEPLLIGVERFESIIQHLKIHAPNVNFRFHLQTNGLLLNDQWLICFDNYNVGFGISLDGPPEHNDNFRIYRNGRGSTQRLLEVIKPLQSRNDFQRLFGGLLCVISDTRIKPSKLLSWFVENEFKSLDFLLPDGNYINLPQGWNGPEPYVSFLSELFCAWLAMGDCAPRVRLFEYMINSMLGIEHGLDALGGDLRSLCVVESDGAIGTNDVARICKPLRLNPLNVLTDPLESYSTAYDFENIQTLSSVCLDCQFLNACGGGYLPHRYDGKTFSNPSLYCKALYNLAQEIETCLIQIVPAPVI